MSFAHPHFEEPRWLWLAVAGPVLLVLLQRYAAAARRRQLARVASEHFLATLTESHSRARRAFKNCLLALAVACIGLALARPQWGEIETKSDWSGEDVIFALDCSQSMMATDVLPNRLQRAKLAVLDFTRRQAHGRAGLVAFAGSAFLQCPLTFDRDAFEDALQSVDAKTISLAGTDIGKALREADKAMEKKSRRKVVVLLTDGEDLEKGGVITAQSLATNGVTVFAIGVGTAAGSEIKVLGATGQPELLRDTKGEVVRSRLDEETLRNIARATGGEYFPLGRVGEGLMKVSRALESRQNALAVTKTRALGVERFHVFVAAMLLLLVGESLIGTRRRLPGSAGVRGDAVLATLLLAAFTSSAMATNESSNSPAPALAPPSPPKTARGLFNAGTRLLAEKKFTDAENFFQASLAKQETEFQPAALFNLGHVRFAQGAEELKKAGSPKATEQQMRSAVETGSRAAQLAEASLAGTNVDQMVQAYLAGRGARKEVRAAGEAYRRAMELYGATLRKWQRSLGDFRSAAELNPADTNATHNAEIVERHIAKLIDSIRQLQQAMMPMMGGRSRLSEAMKQLKGKIPAEKMPPGAPGDDEDDDVPLDGLRGLQEGPSKEGREMELMLSPEEAGRLLDGLRGGAGKRLPFGDSEGGPDEKGRERKMKRLPW
ncbi:MAG: VWA domain-containing protein [Verrucomicrobia bacterium]|nr:MAG: VWA domain-containing protein [Verrucomicrobiota bacterium]